MTQLPRTEKRKRALAQKRLLLVEGPDDEMVVGQLRTLHNLSGTCAIAELDGFTNVRDTFANLLKFDDDEKQKERLAVIVDTDEIPGSRWDSLRAILRAKGYTVPQRPSPQGVILDLQDNPTIGVWLMPDNLQLGKLEDFIALLMQPDDLLWPHVLASVKALPEHRFTTRNTIKAQVHTWLAWQVEPGIQMSQAIRARMLNYDSTTRQNFIAWLTVLFE